MKLFATGYAAAPLDVRAVTPKDQKFVRYAWIGWALLFLVICAMIVTGNKRAYVTDQWTAALHWVASYNLYDDSTGVGGFVYLPQAALFFIPFTFFPPALCEILWRIVNIGVFAAGVRSFSRIAGARSGKELFPLMTLVVIPFAWDCARNGQATLIMTGLMLFTVADMARSRWWHASLWLCLSVAIKPLSIVLLLLVMAGERRMTGRILAIGAVLALAPFLAQSSEYVLRQYEMFVQNTLTAAHVSVVARGWSTPFTALRVAGLTVPEQIQTGVRLVAAFATFVLYLVTKRRFDAENTAVYLFSLAAAYIILFSPRTETVTYALIGPAVAAFLARGYMIEKRLGEGILLSVIAIGAIASQPLQRMIAPHAEQVWLPPLMATVFTAYMVFRLFAGPVFRSDDQHPGFAE